MPHDFLSLHEFLLHSYLKRPKVAFSFVHLLSMISIMFSSRRKVYTDFKEILLSCFLFHLIQKSKQNNIMSDTKNCDDKYGSICISKLEYRDECLKVSQSSSGQCIYPCNNFSTLNCEQRLSRGYKVFFSLFHSWLYHMKYMLVTYPRSVKSGSAPFTSIQRRYLKSHLEKHHWSFWWPQLHLAYCCLDCLLLLELSAL